MIVRIARSKGPVSLWLAFVVGIVALLLCASPVRAQQGPPSATLTWNSVTVPTPAALTYKVQRATVQTGPFSTVATVSVLTATDTLVTRGTTYFYQLLSSCPTTGAGCGTTTSPINGDSGPSNVVSATIPNATTAPPIPTNLTITGVQ
jgi:hypothetical protein